MPSPRMQPPRVILFVTAALIALTLLPLAVIAVARTSTSSRPRIHPVLDMDAQEFFGTGGGTAKLKTASGSNCITIS